MVNYYPLLCPNVCYHVFNRGNNRENVFYNDENYRYFLGKYAKYLSPVVHTYAYCLLPNHFHLAIRVKTQEEIQAALVGLDLPGFKNLEGLNPGDDVDKYIGDLVSNQFRLCFMAYAKAINKQEGRVGSLFQKNFKRLEIHSESYFTRLILYIHANPQLHDIWDDYRDWPHSSYAALLSGGTTKLQRKEVVTDWFGGKEAFIAAHQLYIDMKGLENLMIED